VSRWEPIDPEEIPTAEAVARALVAASRVTGENPVAVIESRSTSRAKYAALDALLVFYPLCPKSWLARYVGGCEPSNLQNQAKKARWWGEVGAAASQAAMAVLEGL
jgi:hypothetical protein